ncbi:hypothetical protein ABET51_00050 [Metabacillus fastidiosus]|uniref:hypothetical protein n=1 Tax=Metabacillus fastidiosus TaxID=1458 RepID=UPI002E22D4DD|nr:hypothetical protein [Metabacillus fastidiosus]
MNICFYDNNEIQPNEMNSVFIDRVYCLDFHKFTELTWGHLGQVYLSLPNCISKENQLPMWFGEEEISPVYLYASVEPSGLQIIGELTLEQWKSWEHIFHEKLSDSPFPFFPC